MAPLNEEGSFFSVPSARTAMSLSVFSRMSAPRGPFACSMSPLFASTFRNRGLATGVAARVDPFSTINPSGGSMISERRFSPYRTPIALISLIMYALRTFSLLTNSSSSSIRATNSVSSVANSSESRFVSARSFISRIALAWSPVNLSDRVLTRVTNASFGEALARMILITASILSIAFRYPRTISNRDSHLSSSCWKHTPNRATRHVCQRARS